MTVRRGDFVTLNGRVGVVLATGAELGPELADHAAVWFGGVEAGQPAVWIVATEVLTPGPPPVFRH